jgi:hypothetical protein
LAALLALAGLPAYADTSGVERTYLERAAISAADASCDLFSEGERWALRSGLYQTEGELLRGGRSPAEIARLTAQVSAHARELGCEHPSVLQVAATIRDSYRQFAKTNWIEYPAKHGVWGASRSSHDAWAVMQIDKASGAMFGLRRDRKAADGESGDPALRLAIAIPAKGRAPASARLFARDPEKMREPWLGSLLGLTDAVAAAPRSLSRPEWAGEFRRERDSADDPIWVWYFGPSAISRMEALDPREGVQIELTPSPLAKDSQPVRLIFEVGDIRAARAFAMIPPPEYTIATARVQPPAH